MSDRSALQLYVYAVDDTDRAAVLDAIIEQDLGVDWGESGNHPPTTLRLGTCYSTHETPLGASNELAAALQENAPSAVFELWQDPYPTTEGHYVAHVPGTGTYEAGCDYGGSAHISVSALVENLSNQPDWTTVQEWLDGPGASLLGVPVLTVIHRYKDAAKTPAA